MKKEFDFFDKKKNIRILKYLSYVLLGAVVGADFFITKEHAHYSWEKIPGAYAVFGLAACVFIVVLAKTIGHKWLMKDEDYYEK
ncbi:hypothetical protein ACFL6Y_04830 [Elusimicrobiota bacterium]